VLLKGLANGSVHASNGVSSGAAPWEASSSAAAAPAQGWYGGAPPAPQQQSQQQQQHPVIPVIATPLHLVAQHQPLPPSSSSPFDSGGDNDAAAAAAGAPASPSSMPRLSHIPDDICVVDTPQKARQVAAMMLDVAERGVYAPSATSSGPRRDPVPVHFAVDTEVAGIDIKEESPVGHGAVVCLSVYAGPWANFNPDAAGPRQPRVWIDLLPGYGPRVVAAERAASEASEVAVQLEQASTLAAARAAEAIKHARAMRAAEASGTKKPRARRRSRSSTSSKAAAASSGGSVDALGADDQLQHQHQQQQPAEAEFLPSTTPEAVALADNLAEEAERAAEQARAARERADAAAALFPPPAPTVAEILGDSQASAILEAFRPFLEADTVEQARAMMVSCGGGRGGGGGAASPSPSATATKLRKIWHNYGFDRHVLGNMGVACGGFAGDTLHLARLHDASRRFNGGFSLEALSSDRGLAALLRADLLRAAGLPPHAASPSASSPSPTDSPQPHQSGLPFDEDDVSLPKRGMRERFGESRVKRDGGLAKAAVVQPMHLLHALPRFRAEWVDYSALDAKATWNVHRALRAALLGREAHMDGHLRELLRVDHVAWQDSVDRAAPPVGVSASAEASAAAMALAAHDPAALSAPRGRYTMWHFYEQYWLPFGRLLTDMEAAGVRVDRAHLAAGEQRAREDQRRAEAVFRAWASRLVPGAAHMNISSGLQVRQLLFPDAVDGGVRSFRAPNPEYDAWKEEKDREKAAGGAGGGAAGRRKTAKLAADGGAADSPSPDLVDGKPARPKRWLDFDLHGVWGRGEPGRLAVETKTDKGAPAVSTAVLRALAGKPGAARRALTELDAKEAAGGEPSSAALLMLPEPLDVSGADGGAGGEGEGGDGEEGDGGGSDGLVSGESGDDGSSFSVQLVAAGGASGKRKKGSAAAEAEAEAARLESLQREGEAMGLGTMYAAMGGGREGVEACCALEALCDVSAVDKLLSAFLVPLQGDSISTPHDHRVHCSLNLNTETGRLSARRPNLQNQPALEKDRYQVRRAFAADVSRGRTLVVADYGQLELRLLAHMTGCKSMIEAFELGGDFHSRTALGMYDHIRAAVDRGDCLLEWEAPHDHDDPSAPQPKPPAPLLKDVFASERRKAKVLNFSIAYGKTARGLSRDWGVPLSEAEETLERWYGDRPEVRAWQERQRAHAREHGYVNTLLGRRRGLLPAIASPDRFLRLRAERAAINTPIQGSAADVAAAAMLAIDADAWLREHGWRLLLQVHDEVMLEGPKETAEEARRRVVAAMANPWAALCGADAGVRPLLVELAVDCKSADTWYEAK
jgi:DNA polymerase I-like protein with 3'-5' exonuclease and polymerase domains